MIVRCAPVILGLLAASLTATAEDPEAKKRVGVMRAAVTALEGSSRELKPNTLTAAPEPLLRYSDPTPRVVCLDAGVWRLGTEGRPTAFVTLELYRTPAGAHFLSYEFLSLTEKKFALKHKTEEVRWDATASGLNLKELPDAPKPAATPAARLAQMRQLARRFSAKETFNKESVECRLLAQPIDRYESEAEKIVDGAIFALAVGTNPEIGIVFESDGQRWRYGTLRFGSAAVTVTLDGKEAVAYERFSARGRDGSYNLGSHKIELGK